MHKDILIGKTNEHVLEFKDSGHLIHRDIIPPFTQLQVLAKDEINSDIQIVSGFRSFERQLLIWNAKAQGKRALLDDHGNELIYNDLSPTEIMFAILRFSAIPGASRHHWGTDLDIFDANEMSSKDVQLTASECDMHGPFGKLHQWLDMKIAQNESLGFYRPYDEDLGGVAPEKWHISYTPLAQKYFDHYSMDIFLNHLQEIEIELKSELLQNAEEIFQRFVMSCL